MMEKKRRQVSVSEPAVQEVFTENYIPTPPDGGWGWVIVMSSLVCNILVDGVAYSFGVFLEDFVVYFKETKSKTSLVGSVLAGTYLCAGPMVSALTNRYGCRPVAVAGSIIGCVAFILATFSPNVAVLIVLYGILGGLGIGLIYLPSIVSVGFYFERKRALATGIAVCGSGIGTFIFAPLGRSLLDFYDWKNALFIIAGLILNGAVCGMLMRPLEPPKKVKKKLPPREKNVIDRIKEQAKGKRFRSESESSTYIRTIKDANTVFERVQEAKLRREKQLNEDESELGSLPSTFFIKRQDSKEPRPYKLSLSDKGDTLSHASSPIEIPKIIVQDTTSPDSETEFKILEDDSSKRRDSSGTGSNVESPSASETPDEPIPDTEKFLEQKGLCKPQYNNPGEVAIKNGKETEWKNDSTSKTFKQKRQRQSSGTGSNLESPAASDTPDGSTDVERSIERRRLSSKIGRQVGSLPNGIPDDTNDATASLIEEIDSKQLVIKYNKDGTKEVWRKAEVNIQAGGSVREIGVPKEDYARPLYRKDIFYSGSIVHIPQFRSQPNVTSYVASITTIPGIITFEKESWIWQYICIPKVAKDTLQEMLDFSLFLDPSFAVICIGNIFIFLGYFIPFVFLTARATEELQIDPQKASFLLSIIGITNTIGRVLTGVLADTKKVDSLVINNVTIVITGIATMLTPFCADYVSMAIFAAVFGFNAAAFVSLTSIIICDLLGLDKLTNAFGLLSMIRGISSVIGPPLAGAVYDSLKSYNTSFYLGGASIIAGGLFHCILFLPKIVERRKKNMGEPMVIVNELETPIEGFVYQE